jgi:tetratricopeptide (TPR) repeat protein
MKQIIKTIIILISILISTSSNGQQDFTQFLPNAQAIAIGGSGAGLANDPAACYWNPASVAFLTTNRVLLSVDNESYINYIGLTRFFPPALSMGINFARLRYQDLHYDMAIIAMGYRFLPFLSVGSNFNFSKTMEDDIYSSFGLGLFFKTVPDYQSRFNSSASLWSWLRSKQMYDKFSFGITLHNVSLNENKTTHQLRFATTIKPHNLGPLIHFAYHLTPEDYSLHLGTITSLSKNFELYFGVRDLTLHNFSVGGAIEWGPFEVDMSYDFKYTKVNFSLMLRLGEEKNVLYQKYKEMGNQQIKDNNFSKALNSYKKALAYLPGNEDIHYLVSVLQKDADQTLEKIDSLLTKGLSFQKQGWYIHAFNCYRKVMEIDQDNRKARSRLSALNSKLKPYLNQIFRQGVVYYNKQDLKRAERIFKQILLVDGTHRDAQIYLARVDSINWKTADEYYYRGLGYYKQNNLARAIQEFKEALTFIPDHELAKDYLDKSERELAKNKQLIDKYLSDAGNYEQNKQYVRATLSYRKILEIDKSHQSARERLAYLDNHISKEIDEKFSRAKRLYDRASYWDAIAVFQEILSIDPDHTASNNYLRRASQKLIDLAQQHYERAQNHFSQKKWDIVLQECDLTLKMNPDHSAAKQLQQMALANISLDKLIDKGLDLYQRGDYLNARSTFRQVLAKEAGNTSAQNYLATIENDLKERVEMLFNMGMVKYTEGAYEEAIIEWKKILGIDPDHQSTKDYIQKAQQRIDALKRIK